MKKYVCEIIVFALILTGIPVNAKLFHNKADVLPNKTQLETREFQTRTYDSKDMKTIMKAIINTLQDDGFNLSSSNTELGIITAKKEYVVKMPRGKEIFIRSIYTVAFGILGLLISNSIVQNQEYCISASANISEFGKNTKVRINFTENTKKDSSKFQDVHDSKLYQAFFEKLDKSLFIQTQGI